MKYLITILVLNVFALSCYSQEILQEVSWEDLEIKEFTKSFDPEWNTEVSIPVFTEKQDELDSSRVIIAGNYQVLSSFDSKTYLLSRDEIIKTPMQRDEIILLDMEEDPEIYFGRKVKISGTLIISKNPDSESIYVLTDVQKVK